MAMNPLLLQKQLRENAANLEEFAKDLKGWSEEMKRKENSVTGVKEIPSKRKIKKSTTDSKSIKPATKIGTTDYAAWDKFDADAELEKLEDDINDESELTDECNEKEYDQAILEKEKGNKFVKLQKWDDAIKCYTKAVECYSYDPIFYANRALCYLKKEMYENAENDCNLSLKLDQTYVKALQRRAAARMEIQKYEHAEHDLLKVLEYEPKNTESKAQLEKLRAKMNKKVEQPSEQRPVSKFTASRNKSKMSSPQIPRAPETTKYEKSDIVKPIVEVKENIDDSKPVSSWPMQDDVILVKPINKKPHLRSEKPLMRIEIKDNDSTMEKTEMIKGNIQLPEEKKTLTAWPKTDERILSLNSDDLKIVERKNFKDEKNNSNNSIIGKLNSGSEVWQKPTTSVQFYSTWNNLKSSNDKYKFLKSIDSEEFPKIFLNSLETSVFSKILEVLAENCTENKDPVSCLLQNLTKVKRFSTLTMFMTDTDKKNLWKLFDHIKETNELNKVDVDKLILAYEL